MKELIAILIILLGIIVISGCTTNTTNKTYTANGVTFQYSSNLNQKNNDTLYNNNMWITVDTWGSLTDFASEEPAIPATLDAAATELHKDLPGNFDKKETMIGGVRAIQYIPTGSGRQRSDIIFVSPNGTLYDIWITSDNYNSYKSVFEGIINSLKFT